MLLGEVPSVGAARELCGIQAVPGWHIKGRMWEESPAKLGL